jgi:hypothetical protein
VLPVVRENRAQTIRNAFAERKAFGQLAVDEIEAAMVRVGTATNSRLNTAESAMADLDAVNAAIDRRQAARIAGDGTAANQAAAEAAAAQATLLTKLRSV